MERQAEVTGYRMWVEIGNGLRLPDSPGLRRVPGRAHPFEDLTDAPMRTIMADRPVAVLLEQAGGGHGLRRSFRQAALPRPVDG